MELEKEQELAIKDIINWYNSNENIPYTLGGPAGSGKSFLVSFLINALNLKEKDIVIGTITGKASLVLHKKGVRNAKTISKLIYDPVTNPSKDLKEATDHRDLLRYSFNQEKENRNTLKLEIEEYDRKIAALVELKETGLKFLKKEISVLSDAKLAIFDEASMISMSVAKDIMSFGCKCLFIGDPYQLPPIVSNEEDHSLLFDKNGNKLPLSFQLTKVIRQALDSPIIKIATDIREGRGLPPYGIYKGQNGNTDIFIRMKKRDLTFDLLGRADQIICGLNNTRNSLNQEIRKKVFGITDPFPKEGEKLICLKNETCGLVNGMIVYAQEDAYSYLKMFDSSYEIRPADEYFFCNVKEDNDGMLFKNCKMFAPHFRTPGDNVEINKINFYKRRDYFEFDFGYVISCHKAQGSEWPKIVVLDDRWGRTMRDKECWQYTAVTRGCNKVLYAD